jgi:hypothetical protein
MKTDLIALLAVIAVSVGVTLLLSKYLGGGGGGQSVTPNAVPSDNPGGRGGWQPGFVSTLVSNGRRGGATPNVAFN